MEHKTFLHVALAVRASVETFVSENSDAATALDALAEQIDRAFRGAAPKMDPKQRELAEELQAMIETEIAIARSAFDRSLDGAEVIPFNAKRGRAA